MKRASLVMILCSSVALIWGTVASAITIPFAYDFSASGLTGPQPTVTGSFAGYFEVVDGGNWRPAVLTSVSLEFRGTSYTVANTGILVARTEARLSADNQDYQGSFLLGPLGRENAGFTNYSDFGLFFYDGGNGLVSYGDFHYVETLGKFHPFAPDLAVTRTIAWVPESDSAITLMTIGLMSIIGVARLRRS